MSHENTMNGVQRFILELLEADQESDRVRQNSSEDRRRTRDLCKRSQEPPSEDSVIDLKTWRANRRQKKLRE